MNTAANRFRNIRTVLTRQSHVDEIQGKSVQQYIPKTACDSGRSETMPDSRQRGKSDHIPHSPSQTAVFLQDFLQRIDGGARNWRLSVCAHFMIRQPAP